MIRVDEGAGTARCAVSRGEAVGVEPEDELGLVPLGGVQVPVEGVICSGLAASTPGMTDTPIDESMPTWAAWTPVPASASSLCRFIAQLRSAAAAAFTLATRGSGQIEPAPVV